MSFQEVSVMMGFALYVMGGIFLIASGFTGIFLLMKERMNEERSLGQSLLRMFSLGIAIAVIMFVFFIIIKLGEWMMGIP